MQGRRTTTILCFAAMLTVSVVVAETFRYRKIDANHSTIGFVVPILGGMSEVHGRFRDFSVDLAIDPSDLTSMEVRAVVRAASIDTGIADRDTHLRSEDFFHADEHPEITFVSERVEVREAGPVVIGALTLRGVTRTIEFPFRLTGTKTSESGKTMVGLAGEFTIDRKEYGIEWSHPDPAFVGDRIRVVLRVLTKLKAPETAEGPEGSTGRR